jgi:flagellar protein FlbD
MIKLTRLHGEPFVLNADLIEFIEPTPDTMISTTTGKKFRVQESVEEVIGRVVEYRRLCVPLRKKPR